MNSSPFFVHQYFFRVDSSMINFWCVRLFKIFQIRNQNISFPNSHRDQFKAKTDTWWYVLAKLMKSCLMSRWNRMTFNHCSKRYFWPFEWFSKSSFKRSFPVCQVVLDISLIATAFHRISPPFFIQSWLQQYCRSPFLNSAYGSFSNAIRLGSMRCWWSMIPW